MTRRGIVQNPLTPGEVFDFVEAVSHAVPRNLDSDKVRADLMHKKGLARDLGKFFRDRYAAQSASIDLASWTDFYARIFGKKVDLSGIVVAQKPQGDHWPIVIVPGITNNHAFAACEKTFGASRYTDDLNTIRDIVERPRVAYCIWVKATIEADPDLANVSAEQIAERKLNTITLLERLILELKYFDETKQHLDIENVTLGASSRDADGGVPDVGWSSGSRRLRVYWAGVDGRDSFIRARAAVSPDVSPSRAAIESAVDREMGINWEL